MFGQGGFEFCLQADAGLGSAEDDIAALHQGADVSVAEGFEAAAEGGHRELAGAADVYGAEQHHLGRHRHLPVGGVVDSRG